MTPSVQQPDYEGAEFTDLSMAGATFREVDLSGARMRGVLLLNADIDGAIDGLRINGVEVMPLIEAELDRLHPERLLLRPTTPETMRDAVDVTRSSGTRRSGAHACCRRKPSTGQ